MRETSAIPLGAYMDSFFNGYLASLKFDKRYLSDRDQSQAISPLIPYSLLSRKCNVKVIRRASTSKNLSIIHHIKNRYIRTPNERFSDRGYEKMDLLIHSPTVVNKTYFHSFRVVIYRKS